MRKLGGYVVFVIIAGLIGAVVVFGGSVGEPVSQSDKLYAAANLTMITVSPYRVSIPVNATSSTLIVNAIHTQNGSSGAMKVVTNNVTFISRNDQVAVVNLVGQITGVSPGTTNVTVSYTENNVTKTAEVPVTITAVAGT